MSIQPRILAFGGSLRRESFNQKLATIIAAGAREAGAEVTLIALRDFSMPLYDGDIETASGLPEQAKRLKALFREHHGLLIASPEYNRSMTAAFKNAIDWVSRAEQPDEVSVFVGKTAGLCSASPGALGGLQSLIHVRAMLSNIGVNVLPDQVAVSQAHKAFTPEGGLVDPKLDQKVRNLGGTLARHLTKLLA